MGKLESIVVTSTVGIDRACQKGSRAREAVDTMLTLRASKVVAFVRKRSHVHQGEQLARRRNARIEIRYMRRGQTLTMGFCGYVPISVPMSADVRA